MLCNISPFQKLFGHVPDYAFPMVFWCACFSHLLPYNSHKFKFRSSKCAFLGYSAHHKGYKCLHPSGRIYISKNVVFCETKFPCESLFQHNPSSVFVSGLPTVTFTRHGQTAATGLHIDESLPFVSREVQSFSSSPITSCSPHHNFSPWAECINCSTCVDEVVIYQQIKYF